jgi:hypothetical protein
MEWLMSGCEDVPVLPNSYIISFTPFYERGFTMPPHPFL